MEKENEFYVRLRTFHHPNEMPPNDLLMTPVIIILVRNIIICGPTRGSNFFLATHIENWILMLERRIENGVFEGVI